MTSTEQTNYGPFESLRRLMTGAAGVLRNRVELFGVELEQEQRRAVEVLMLGGAALVLAFLASALFTLVIILLFAEPYRIYAAVGLFVVYGAGATALAMRIKAELSVPPFDETLNQAKKDFECLTPPTAKG